MKLNTENLQIATLTLAVAAALSACGGGGGGTTSAGGDATTTTVTTTTTTTAAGPADSVNGNIVTSVSPANYAAGQHRNAYDYLNAQRQACGFGLLAQSTRLDTAAQGHTDYMVANGMGLGHTQNSALSGYTGTTLADRVTAAGYPFITASEVISAETNQYGATFGQANVMNLFSAPYHGLGLLRSQRDVGVGYGIRGAGHIVTMNFGTTASSPVQLLAASQIRTYPCAGTMGVLAKSYNNEQPTPITGRNLATTPIGTPIYLKVRDGQTLVLNTYDLREAGANTSETLIVRNKGNDAANPDQWTDNSEAFLMPDAPLKTNTLYRFQASGTNNGQAFTVDFTFTTGAF